MSHAHWSNETMRSSKEQADTALARHNRKLHLVQMGKPDSGNFARTFTQEARSLIARAMTEEKRNMKWPAFDAQNNVKTSRFEPRPQYQLKKWIKGHIFLRYETNIPVTLMFVQK